MVEVPLASNLFIRTSVRGDVAENDVTGELFDLNVVKSFYQFGENEDGAWLSSGPKDDSIWLEFDKIAMQDGDQIYFITDDGDNSKLYEDEAQKTELKVFKISVPDHSGDLAVSTNTFAISIEGARRFWKLNTIQDLCISCI